MSTRTHALHGAGAVHGAGSKLAEVCQRAFERIVAGQERRANAMVDAYLASLSDEQLAELGYGRVAIMAIRKRAAHTTVPWL